jgi:hypothetical protein
VRAPPAAALLALCLAACGGSPAERVPSALEGVRSWVATARVACGHWRAGRAPARYTRVTLQAALEAVEGERAGLASSPRLVADEQVGKALRVIGDVEAALGRLWAAVGENDPSRVREEQANLDGLDGRLRALGARETTP